LESGPIAINNYHHYSFDSCIFCMCVFMFVSTRIHTVDAAKKPASLPVPKSCRRERH